MRPNQQEPRNAYVSLATLQSRLAQPERVNALVVAGRSIEAIPTPQDEEAIQSLLRPTLADYGLSLERTARGYLNFTSDRLILPPAAERAISDHFCGEGGSVQPVLVYLANQIARRPAHHPLLDGRGPGFHRGRAAGAVSRRTWKTSAPAGRRPSGAELLGGRTPRRQVGDPVRITYFEPNRGKGEFREASVSLRLAAIIPLTGAAADRRWCRRCRA